MDAILRLLEDLDEQITKLESLESEAKRAADAEPLASDLPYPFMWGYANTVARRAAARMRTIRARIAQEVECAREDLAEPVAFGVLDERD